MASKDLLTSGENVAEEAELSSEDDSGERPPKSIKTEHDTVGTSRQLRSRASGRSMKGKAKASTSTTGSIKTEPARTPILAPRSLPNSSRFYTTLLGKDSSQINRIAASSSPDSISSAAHTASSSGVGERSSFTRPQFPIQGNPSSSSSMPYMLSFSGIPPVEDTEVQDFLYDTVAHMRDSNADRDDAATQFADIPPYAGASGEFDGIDGRSFQHRYQRQMQRERLDLEARTRQIPSEALPIPAFLSHIPNPHQPQQHGSNDPRRRQQNVTRSDSHLPPPPLHPGMRTSHSETSLAHAVDETYLRQPIPHAPLSVQAEPPFLHDLSYPRPSSSHHLSPTPHLYTPPALLASPNLQEMANHPSSYIKPEPSWSEQEEDPNDYILRASEGSNSAFNDPRFSYAAAAAASQSQNWNPENYHYQYEDHSMS